MPVAVRKATETERFELKTLPEGFVVLRKLSYGEILERRALMKLTFATQGKSKNLEGEIAMANAKVNNYEFAHCVVEHNLEKEDGTLLNLGNPNEVRLLDPLVGQEVEKIIEKMNNLDDDEEDLKNSNGE